MGLPREHKVAQRRVHLYAVGRISYPVPNAPNDISAICTAAYNNIHEDWASSEYAEELVRAIVEVLDDSGEVASSTNYVLGNDGYWSQL